MARFYQIWIGPEFNKRKNPYIRVDFNSINNKSLNLPKSEWVKFFAALAVILNMEIKPLDGSVIPDTDDDE